MTLPITSHRLRLAPEVVEAAKQKVLTSAALNYVSAGERSRVFSTFARLRRLRNETRNLLVDLQVMERPNAQASPIAFLVPHTNLFDGFSNPVKEIDKFLFAPDFGLEETDEDIRRLRIRFQLGDVFKVWTANEEPRRTSRFRNILLDVSVEEFHDLLASLTRSTTQALAPAIRTALLNDAIHPPHAFDALMTLTDRLEAVAAGVWQVDRFRLLELHDDIELISRFIDKKLSATLDDMLSSALKSQAQREWLRLILDRGEIYRLNSCPDLPDHARRIYGELQASNSLRFEFETLTGQLRDVVSSLNEAPFSPGRPKSGPQVRQDARLLATIHLVNLVLEGDSGSVGKVAQLVTNADRMSVIIGAFPAGALRVPVRHPRLLAWVLEDETVVSGIDRPLSVAATMLDDFVSEVEGGAPISLASIREFSQRLAPSWTAVTENLVMASGAVVAASSGARPTPKSADRHISKRLSEIARQSRMATPPELSDRERRFSFARLDVMSAQLAQERLFDSDAGHRARRMNAEPMAAVEASDTREGMVIVPVAGQLPYAVRLPKIAGENLVKTSEANALGHRPVSFDIVRQALDPQLAVKAPAVLAEIMANRLTFVLAALGASNWAVVHAICGHAIQQFDAADEAQRSGHAKELLQDLVFARQLASRGLAAQSRSNPNIQTIYLLSAHEDLTRLAELDRKDLSVILARATLENEALVLKATLGPEVNNHPLFSAWMSEVSTVSTIAVLESLCETLSQKTNDAEPARTHADFVLFRVLEFLMSTHLIVWSEQIEAILTSEERHSVLEEQQWPQLFRSFCKQLGRMNAWRAELGSVTLESGVEKPAFPFAEFLAIYGQIVLEPTFQRPQGNDIRVTFDQAKEFFGLFDKLNAKCEQLSEQGFARRIARRAKQQIIRLAQKELKFRVDAGFLSLLPETERAWIRGDK